tara:strand:+ start:238 stop:960 length:723 start_codon:yes stop_codon:yes gene_type:complete
MEALLIEYAKKYGMEKAMEMLGLNKNKPKYTFGMPFTNKKISFNPINMIANQGFKALSGSSGLAGMALPAGLLLGLASIRNPLNPKAMNYMPGLAQEMDFAAKKGLISRNPNFGGLQYNTNSVLAGQNVVSGFGTNSYIGQLEKKANYFENRLAKGKNINEKTYAKTLNELAEAKGFTTEKNKTKDYGPYTGGNNDNDGGSTGSTGSKSSGSSKSGGHSGSGYQGASGSHHYRRGGIASL